MSQIIKNLLSGPIPPQVLLTLTPNSGGAVSSVSNNINVVGLAANAGGNAYPIFSYNGGAGQFNIENRTYWTPYVVDQSGTNGRKGTFSSIQAAVNQAVADGATSSNQVTIFIRTGYYTENLVIPNNAALNFVGLGNIDVVLGGNWTFGSGCTLQFDGLTWETGSNNTGLTIPTVNECNFINCFFTPVDSSSTIFNITGQTDYVNFYNCVITGICKITGTTNFFPVQFLGCEIYGSGAGYYFETAGSAIALYESCYFVNIDILLAAGGVNRLTNSYIYDSNISGSSTNVQQLYHNIFSNCSTPVNATATFWTASNTADNGSAIFGSNPTILSQPTQMGNISAITLPAGTSYTVLLTDQFVGCPTTSAYAVTLPASPLKGETHTIKDITGNAAANNITISPAAGNIDGSSSYLINNNYGSATVVYSGTQWFII